MSDHGKINAERPTRERLIHEFGESSYKVVGHDKEGREKYRIDVDGKKNVNKLFEIYAKQYQMKAERSEKFQSKIPKVRMMDKETGMSAMVPTFKADYAGRYQGLVEKTYWGRPSYRLTEAEVKARIEAEKNVGN